MRALQTNKGHLTLISTTQGRVFEKIELTGTMNSVKMTERDINLADELVRLDLVDSNPRGQTVDYTVVKQSGFQTPDII